MNMPTAAVMVLPMFIFQPNKLVTSRVEDEHADRGG